MNRLFYSLPLLAAVALSGCGQDPAPKPAPTDATSDTAIDARGRSGH